jgi:hypothetical protein
MTKKGSAFETRARADEAEETLRAIRAERSMHS